MQKSGDPTVSHAAHECLLIPNDATRGPTRLLKQQIHTLKQAGVRK